jgi:hypothetical protein
MRLTETWSFPITEAPRWLCPSMGAYTVDHWISKELGLYNAIILIGGRSILSEHTAVSDGLVGKAGQRRLHVPNLRCVQGLCLFSMLWIYLHSLVLLTNPQGESQRNRTRNFVSRIVEIRTQAVSSRLCFSSSNGHYQLGSGVMQTRATGNPGDPGILVLPPPTYIIK